MSIFIVSKAEFSDIVGVTRQTSNGFFKPGGSLADCLINGMVDLKHKKVQAYIVKREKKTGRKIKAKGAPKPQPKPKAPPKKKPKPAESPTEEPPEEEETVYAPSGYDIVDYENYTVREIVMQFGNIDAFKRFVESLKNIADYKLKEVNLQTRRGELVERQAVKGVVFPLIDGAFTRLVSDVPAALSKQLKARIESGGEDTLTDVEEMIRTAISQVLKNLKKTMKETKALTDGN